MKWQKNMGMVDRVVRIVIALVIGYLYFTNKIEGTLGIVLLIVAAIFLLTSIVSFCPLYTLFGIRTCKVKQS